MRLALVAAGVLLACLAAALPSGCSRAGREAKPPERIVLIVIDTLRRDHVSAYGSAVATPHIDAIAEGGQRLTNAFSSFHQTTMSMASLFTGHTPSLDTGRPRERHDLTGHSWCGMLRFGTPDGRSDCIPASVPTLATRLGEAGYWTLGVVTNQLLYRPGGYERGFQRWIELAKPAPTAADANLVLRRALAGRPGDRLFLYLHYMDVHDYGRRSAPYASGVEIADQGVGHVMEILEREGLLEDSLVILTSDHGERLESERHFVEGHPGHNGSPSFDSLLRIPLLTRPPLFENADAFVRLDDLHRRILEVAGAAPGPEPDLDAGEVYVSEMLFQTYRRGRWKSYRDRTSGALHLVDLEADPGETRDVAAGHPEVAAEHRRRIEALEDELAARDAPELELSDADRARLNALGYVRMIRLKPGIPPAQSPEPTE